MPPPIPPKFSLELPGILIPARLGLGGTSTAVATLHIEVVDDWPFEFDTNVVEGIACGIVVKPKRRWIA